MAEIQLHGKNARGRVALVDDADLPLVTGYRWNVKEDRRLAGGTRSYAVRHYRDHGRQVALFMHQVLTGQMWADHENGDGLDNRRVNLREAAPAQNLANKAKKPGCRSRYIGVTWHDRDSLWHATAGRVSAGYYKDEEDAARARDVLAIEIYAEFARLNFPAEDAGRIRDKILTPRRSESARKARETIMATFKNRRIGKMATFSQWLAGHEDGPQDSPVAWLARQWKALEGNRPRVSSPSGIERHLLTLAPPDDPAAADQWTGFVHQAVNEATADYKSAKLAEQSGPGTSPGEQLALTGQQGETNPVTGKPVAIVSTSQWRRHPDASVLGSCTACGWPRGFADLGQGAGEQMMCAAGHVFSPELPQHEAPAPGETVITLSGPLTPIVGSGGAGPVMTGSDPEHDAVYEQAAGDAAEVGLLALVNLKLTTIMISLGLPTDPGQMAELITAAAESDQLLSDQLREADIGRDAMDAMPPAAAPEHPDTGKGGWRAAGQALANGQLPDDFAALYGMADPSATDG